MLQYDNVYRVKSWCFISLHTCWWILSLRDWLLISFADRTYRERYGTSDQRAHYCPSCPSDAEKSIYIPILHNNISIGPPRARGSISNYVHDFVRIYRQAFDRDLTWWTEHDNFPLSRRSTPRFPTVSKRSAWQFSAFYDQKFWLYVHM